MTLTYTQEVVEHTFDKYVEQATDRLIHQLTDPGLRSVVKRLAKTRLIAGIETFGDSGWKKHPDDLMIEILQELADGIAWTIMRENARSGGPGSHYGERS